MRKNKKIRRHYNVRLIRANLSYTVQDLTQLLNVHENTVRKWLKAGLQTIDRSIPFMIHGQVLRDFLSRRQESRKVRLQPDELYCVKCRCPRHAAGSVIEITYRNSVIVNLRGKCDTCDTRMQRTGNSKRLDEYRSIFGGNTLVHAHITDTASTKL